MEMASPRIRSGVRHNYRKAKGTIARGHQFKDHIEGRKNEGLRLLRDEEFISIDDPRIRANIHPIEE